MNTKDGKAPMLWFTLTMPVLAVLLVECLFYHAGGVPPPARCLGTATCTLTVAYLMWPMAWNDGQLSPRRILAWCAVTAAAAALLMMASSPSGTWLSLTAPLCGGVLSTAVLLGALTLSLTRVVGLTARNAHRVVLVTLLLATTTPLWLGPLAARLAAEHFTDTLIAVSPVGYLTSLIDYDVLRSSWFYMNTPLGGLRYDYPNPVILTGVYGGLAALLVYLGNLRRLRPTLNNATVFASLHPVYKEPTS